MGRSLPGGLWVTYPGSRSRKQSARPYSAHRGNESVFTTVPSTGAPGSHQLCKSLTLFFCSINTWFGL